MPTLSQQAAELFGITLTEVQAEQFAIYARELAAWNSHTNLTAITDEEGIQVRHFLDSLSVVSAAAPQPGQRVMDVGTGAGFPGLPLKIVFPQIQLTLLEATGKKVEFLNHVAAAMGLPGVTALHARAEEAGHMPTQRAAYDLVLARAVTRLPALVEYLLPLAKVGGRCIAMKGRTAFEEVRDSGRALNLLGGRVNEVLPVSLPGIDEARYLVIIEKVTPTPAPYPRAPGTPTRKPL